MALKQYGLTGYRRLIEHDLALAEHLVQRIRAHPDLELVAASLSTVNFRYAPAALAGDEERLGALNTAIVDNVQLGGQVFVSGTTLRGKPVVRACVVNPRSSYEDMELLVEEVLEAGARIAHEDGRAAPQR
jgi:glutamate/tyrosine decarboxylase-like PLP-dependent enzyme